MKSRSGSSGFEDDDVSAPDVAHRQDRSLEGRRLRAKHELVHQQMVAISRLFSMDPVESERPATHVRTKSARITAVTIASDIRGRWTF